MRASSHSMISFGVASPAAIFSTIGTSISASSPANGRPLTSRKQPDGEKSGSLVAIRQRVIASQMLDEDGRFLNQGGLLGEAAQRLAISLDRGLDPALALRAASGQAEAQLVSLDLRGG